MSKDNRLYRKLTQDNYITEKIDVIHNNLLGSYNDDGDYIIAPKIVEELISLNKTKKTAFGNSIFCVGRLLGYRELVFELMFNDKTQENNASATLYVLEDVDKINGYLQNTFKTKLGTYSSDVENFIESTYEHFNISVSDDDDDDEGMDRKLIDDLNNEDSFIIAKKQFSLLLEKLLTEKYLDAYGKYFTYRMSTLTKSDNEFSKSVLERFNNQYKLIENVFLHEKNYKILNELLDKCIEEVSGTSEQMIEQENEFLDKVAPALESFTDNMKKLSERYEAKALNMLEKNDRKKVEEVLDEIKDYHALEDENEIESKPSVEQIVNDAKTSTKVEVDDSKEKQEEEKSKEEDKELDQNTSYIKDMLDSKKQAKEELYSNIQKQESQSFYDTFVGGHSIAGQATEQPKKESKVVDTSLSDSIEDPNNSSSVAVSSLKARINRLQKFKDDNYSLEEDKVSTDIENVFDTSEKESIQMEDNLQDNELTDPDKLNEYLKRRNRISELDMER